MVKCENPRCTHYSCKRFVKYGDMILCSICYNAVPNHKRSEAIWTSEHQGIEDLLAPKEGADKHG